MSEEFHAWNVSRRGTKTIPTSLLSVERASPNTKRSTYAMYRQDRYPRNWRELAIACKDRANWQCQVCGVTQKTERISQRTGVVYAVFLHAAHTTLHDTTNQQPELQALCPTCHGRLDWQLRKSEAEGTLEKHKHQFLLASRK